MATRRAHHRRPCGRGNGRSRRTERPSAAATAGRHNGHRHTDSRGARGVWTPLQRDTRRAVGPIRRRSGARKLRASRGPRASGTDPLLHLRACRFRVVIGWGVRVIAPAVLDSGAAPNTTSHHWREVHPLGATTNPGIRLVDARFVTVAGTTCGHSSPTRANRSSPPRYVPLTWPPQLGLHPRPAPRTTSPGQPLGPGHLHRLPGSRTQPRPCRAGPGPGLAASSSRPHAVFRLAADHPKGSALTPPRTAEHF